MPNRARNETPALGLGQCGYCGGIVVPIPNTAIPTREQLESFPWNANCVTSPRWRWCRRKLFFACWYGKGEPPATIPGMSLAAAPDEEDTEPG